MSPEQEGRVVVGPGPDRRSRARRLWIPAAWTVYGAAYVAVFVTRGQVMVGVLAGALTLAVGLGIAYELRQPSAGNPRLLGWAQDERQGQIHLRAAAGMGYVAAAGALISGFTEFALGRSPVLWMNALGVLILAYVAGLVYFTRRT